MSTVEQLGCEMDGGQSLHCLLDRLIAAEAAHRELLRRSLDACSTGDTAALYVDLQQMRTQSRVRNGFLSTARGLAEDLVDEVRRLTSVAAGLRSVRDAAAGPAARAADRADFVSLVVASSAATVAAPVACSRWQPVAASGYESPRGDADDSESSSGALLATAADAGRREPEAVASAATSSFAASSFARSAAEWSVPAAALQRQSPTVAAATVSAAVANPAGGATISPAASAAFASSTAAAAASVASAPTLTGSDVPLKGKAALSSLPATPAQSTAGVRAAGAAEAVLVSAPAAAGAGRGAAATASAAVDMAAAEERLFEAMLGVRLEISQSRDVPGDPRVIASDGVLKQMVKRRPSTVESMANIKGITQQSLRYADALLAGLREQCAALGLQLEPDGPATSLAAAAINFSTGTALPTSPAALAATASATTTLKP